MAEVPCPPHPEAFAAGLGPDTPLPALFRTGRMARLLDGPDELHITAVARRILQ